MKSVLLGMLAETAIHPGTGRSGGVIDLPVAREAVTNYPYIPGSSLKGALREKAGKNENVNKWFGKEDAAGELLVSDARLLLLPVRSLTGSYRWLTCPLIVERLQRDLRRAGFSFASAVPSVKRRTAQTHGTGNIYLEERQFTIDGQPEQALTAMLEKFIAHETTRGRVTETVAVVHDDDFAWFASYGPPVQARNKLDDDTKQSKNLWYEESLPPDTLMYALVAARSDSASDAAGSLFKDDPYLQTGGNETVGEGWFIVEQVKEGS